MSRIKKVHSDHAAGIGKNGSHFGNRQRRCIGGKDYVGATDAFQLLPDLLLGLHVLHDGFDDQIDIFHVFQRGGGSQLIADQVVQVGCGHFLLFDEVVKGLADRRQSLFNRLIVDFPQYDVESAF